MATPSQEINLPDDFAGQVRLFPLPNLVLFPGALQALHIFEPRYCDMLDDALHSDHLVSMALLKPGWEVNFTGRPPIEDVICIGKVLSHSPTEDHRHNILLAGLRRARIVREIPGSETFRRAEVHLLEDEYPESGVSERSGLRQRLANLIEAMIPPSHASDLMQQLLGKTVPLGILTDMIASALKMPIVNKQRLLATVDVDVRCKLLIDAIQSERERNLGDSRRNPPGFPPPFSNN